MCLSCSLRNYAGVLQHVETEAINAEEGEEKEERRRKEKKNTDNKSEMPTTDGLYNSVLASSIRDPNPLFGRQNGLVR